MYRKAPVLECLFNKVGGLQVSNFTNKKLQHRFFPVNLANILKNPFLTKVSQRLLRYFCDDNALSQVLDGILNTITQNAKISIKDFFIKCPQICSSMQIQSHLLKKPLTVFRMGFFGATTGMSGTKRPTSLNLSHTSYNDKTYTLYTGTVIPYLKMIRFKKYMNKVTHSLSSAGISIFYRKSETLPLSKNKDRDFVFIDDFYSF